MKKEHRELLTELYFALGKVLLDLDSIEETAQPKPQAQPQPKTQPKKTRAKAQPKTQPKAQPKTNSGAKSKPKSGVGIRALRQDESAKAKIAEMMSAGMTVNAIATAVGATWEAAKKIIDEMENK